MRARTRTMLMATVVALCLPLIATTPASAHTRDQAIAAGCGPNFRLVADGTRNVGTWGQVHLAYYAGVNCVVTRKTGGFHGTPSRIDARLTVEGEGSHYKTDPAAGHWEAVKARAAGKCVQYYGWIFNPAGTDWRGGGRLTWGNCG